MWNSYWTAVAAEAEATFTSRQHLMMSQQLDEVFRVIQLRAQRFPSERGSVIEALQVFQIYDQRFLDETNGRPGFEPSCQFASERLELVKPLLRQDAEPKQPTQTGSP
ncbi:MAG: hypothetical protein WBD31_15330 [Rubripirellula sp.]